MTHHRAFCHVLFGVCALSLVAGCQSGGHFSIFGYTTRPNYDECYHTVYVPIFQNTTFRRDLEFELTRAVIREIEAKTPYKVVSDRAAADTELCGTIISLNKNILNRNQLNEVREAETVLAVQVTWRDTKTGTVLSQARPHGPDQMPLILGPDGVPVPIVPPTVPGSPGAGGADLPPPTPLPHDLPPGVAPPPPPILVTSQANFIPELGESLATAEKRNVDRLAVQIVSMMEKPW